MRSASGTGADSFEALERLVRAEATGELICATDDAEIHVHLQQGRVAWATTSSARFAFARYVLEACAIESEVFRELVLECRRERKPLGETLVEWGLATRDQVREALRRQVLDALATLPTECPVSSVFLRRGDGYQSYARDFTFAWEEVVPDRPPSPKPPSSFPGRLSSRPPPANLAAELEALVAEGGEVRWAEHHVDGQVRARAPAPTAPRGIEELAARAFASEVDFVAIRSEEEGLLGFEMTGGRGSVWCGLSADAVLGAALTLVRSRLERHAKERPSRAPAGLGAARLGADRGVARETLQEVFDRTPELWAVAMRDRQGELEWLAWRDRLERDQIAQPLRPLTNTLVAARALSSVSGGLGFGASSMVASTPHAWFFGGELLDGSLRDLWLVVDPLVTQGLGWALLTSLLRRTSLTSREVRG